MGFLCSCLLQQIISSKNNDCYYSTTFLSPLGFRMVSTDVTSQSSPANDAKDTSLTFLFAGVFWLVTFCSLTLVCPSDPSHLPTVPHPVPFHLGHTHLSLSQDWRLSLRHGTFNTKARKDPGKLRPAGHPEFILAHFGRHSVWGPPHLEVNTYCLFWNSPQLIASLPLFSLSSTIYQAASHLLPLASVAFGSRYT